MVATIILRYDKKKNNISFQNQEANWNSTDCGVPHFMIVLPYQFIKSFLDNKMSVFEEYGAFKLINRQ